MITADEPLAQDHLHIVHGRRNKQFDRPLPLFFREQPHADQRNEEQADDSNVREERSDDLLIQVHRARLARSSDLPVRSGQSWQ